MAFPLKWQKCMWLRMHFVMAALGVTYSVITIFYFILICDVWHFEGFACSGHDGKQLNHAKNIENCQVKYQNHMEGWDNKVSSDLSLVMAVRAMGSLLPLDFRSGAGNIRVLPRFKSFLLNTGKYGQSIRDFANDFPEGNKPSWEITLFVVVLYLYVPTLWHFATSTGCICKYKPRLSFRFSFPVCCSSVKADARLACPDKLN